MHRITQSKLRNALHAIIDEIDSNIPESFERGINGVRQQMRKLGVSQKDIEFKLNRGHDYVSRCFSGKASFTMQEAYSILLYLNLPLENIYDLFPPQ